MAEKLAKTLIGMMSGLLSLSFGKQLVVFIISMLMQMYSNKRLVSKNIRLDTRSE